MPPTGERLVTCAACGMSYTPRDPVERARATRRRGDEDELPAGVTVARTDDGVTIRVAASKVVGLASFVVTLPMLYLPLATDAVVFILMGPVAAGMAYLGVTQLGSIEYVITGGELRVRHRPLPVGPTTRIPAAQIERVELEEGPSKHGRRYLVQLVAPDLDRRTVFVTVDEDKARALHALLREAIARR